MDYVICIKNQDYTAALEIRKIYSTVPDPKAETYQMIRVIDESGEDYLYPTDYFLPLQLSEPVKQAIATTL